MKTKILVFSSCVLALVGILPECGNTKAQLNPTDNITPLLDFRYPIQ